jgi:hypothetical protein
LRRGIRIHYLRSKVTQKVGALRGNSNPDIRFLSAVIVFPYPDQEFRFAAVKGVKRSVGPAGEVVCTLRTRRVVESSSTYFQRDFDDANLSLADEIAQIGVTAEAVQNGRATLQIYVSLMPGHSDSGITLTSKALLMWSDLGAELTLEAL